MGGAKSKASGAKSKPSHQASRSVRLKEVNRGRSSIPPRRDQNMPSASIAQCDSESFARCTASGWDQKMANNVNQVTDVLEEINKRLEAQQQRRDANRMSLESQFAPIRRIADGLDPGRLERNFTEITANEALEGADLAGRKIYSLQVDALRAHIAERKAECAICWEPLVEKPLGVLADAFGRRSCSHFLHAQCAAQWARSGRASCPICRSTCHSVIVLPDFSKDAEAFFKALDVDRDGSLDRKEAMFTLQAILPVDRDGHWLAAHFEALWERWDENENGRISLVEFIQPETGLLAYVRAHCPSRGMTTPQALIPSTANTRQWFAYWDEDGNGVLDQNEVVRAVIRTFHLDWSLQEVCAVQRFLKNLWKAQKRTGEISITLEDLEVGFWEQLASTIEGRRCELRNPDDINEESADDPPKSVGKSSKSPGKKHKRRLSKSSRGRESSKK